MNYEERAALRPDLIILDEFHRCGAEEWGKGVRAMDSYMDEDGFKLEHD